MFRPTGTSRVSVFRVLRYIRSVAISSTFCVPRCLPSLFGFLPESAWAPLPCGRSRSFRFATSLRPGPWLIVSFELVPVVRFGSASELCSRLFRALPVARFHPCHVSALSPDFLSPFEVSGFRCPARPCGLPFPLRSFDCPGVSLHLEVALPRCYPSGAPSLGFLPFTFLQIQARFRSRLIFVHLKAYELSPVQLLPLLRPTHGFTHCCALKFKVFRIAIRFSKILAPLARKVKIPQTNF